MYRKSYWLYLEPYVYLSIKKSQVLVYNFLNGKSLQYKSNSKIAGILRKLGSQKNLYVIKIFEEDLDDPEISSFLKKLKNYFMGDLLKISWAGQKPFQMMPIMKVKMRDFNETPSLDHLLNHLFELSIYINNRCNQNCEVCKYAYRQFLFCTKYNHKNKELEIEKIKKLFKEIKGRYLKKISILGGNIFEYSEFIKLNTLLKDFKIEKNFYINYLNLKKHYTDHLTLLKGIEAKINILIHSPFDQDNISVALELVEKTDINYEFVIIIEGNKDIEMVERFANNLKITNFSLHPYYNHRNLAFFKKVVFIRKSDIIKSKHTQKEIFSKMEINPLNFGCLTVFCNGDSFANINLPVLGNIDRYTLYDLVRKEILTGKSWRLTRKKVKPCKECIFEMLCPPISNYEMVIEQNNLCHIQKTNLFKSQNFNKKVKLKEER